MNDSRESQSRTHESRLQETIFQGRQDTQPELARCDVRPTELEPDLPFTIPPITIEKLLARGGMSLTYLGHAKKVDDRVVVKIPLWHDPATLNRFNSEILNLKELKHPSIVRMRGAGNALIPFGPQRQLKKLPCLVMEYIDGQSLRQRIRNEKVITWADVRCLLKDILEALDYLDSKKVCHLDIKPDNIIFDRRKNRWILVDFGISRSSLGNMMSSQTMSADGVGSWAYMSPEQFQGVSGALHVDARIDIRSDIYSLGTTAWEALIGAVPRHGTLLPSAVRGEREIPQEVDTLLSKMVAHEPSARYESPKAVISALTLGATRLERRADRRRRWRRFRTRTLTVVAVAATICLGWYLGDYIVTRYAKDKIASEGSPTRAIQQLKAIANYQVLGWGHRFISAKVDEFAPKSDDERRTIENKFTALKQLSEQSDSDQKSKFDQVDDFLSLNRGILTQAEESEGQLIRDRLFGTKISAESRDLEKEGDGKAALHLCEAALKMTTSVDAISKIQKRKSEIAATWSEKWLHKIDVDLEASRKGDDGSAYAKQLVNAESRIQNEIIGPLGQTSENVETARQKYDRQLWQCFRHDAEQFRSKDQFTEARACAKRYASQSRVLFCAVEMDHFVADTWVAEENFEWNGMSVSARKNMQARSFPRAIQDVAAYRKKWLETEREFPGQHRKEAETLADEICEKYFALLSTKYLDAANHHEPSEQRYEQFKDEMDVWRQLNLGETERYARLSAILSQLISEYVEQLVEKVSEDADGALIRIKYEGQCLERERLYLNELIGRARETVHQPGDLQAKWAFRWQLQRSPQVPVLNWRPREKTVALVTLCDMTLQMSDEYFAKLKGKNNANPRITIDCGKKHDDKYDLIYSIRQFDGPVNSQTVTLPEPPRFYVDTAEVTSFRFRLRDADEDSRFVSSRWLAPPIGVYFDSQQFCQSGSNEFKWDDGSTIEIKYNSE